MNMHIQSTPGKNHAFASFLDSATQIVTIMPAIEILSWLK